MEHASLKMQENTPAHVLEIRLKMPCAKWRRSSPGIILACTCYVAHEAQKPKQDIYIFNKVTALLSATWDYEGLQKPKLWGTNHDQFYCRQCDVCRRSHYLTQCAGLLSVGPSGTNFSEILIKIFIHENESENIVREMAAILFRGIWINHVWILYIIGTGICVSSMVHSTTCVNTLSTPFSYSNSQFTVEKKWMHPVDSLHIGWLFASWHILSYETLASYSAVPL